MMRAFLLIVVLLFSETLYADMPTMSDDGWYRWQIESPEGGHMYCWQRDFSYTSKCDAQSNPGALYIYARKRKGDIVELRIRSEQCSVEGEDEFRDLGVVANVDSIGWLKALAEANTRASEDATGAIAAHASIEALPVLISLVENKRLDQDVREQALFWVVQSSDDEAYVYLDKLLVGR